MVDIIRGVDIPPDLGYTGSMTHDELLGYINNTTNDDAIFMKDALRAVVELHKPYQHEVVSYVFCMGCTIDLDLAPPYPCETIQAIEKELQ